MPVDTGERAITLDIETIEILLGLRPVGRRDAEDIAALRRERGDSLERDIAQILLRRPIADAAVARTVVSGIAGRKRRLDELLGRDSGLPLVALDYLHTVHDVLDDPGLAAASRVRELASRGAAVRVYDKGLLLADLTREVERTRRYGQGFAVLLMDLDRLGAVAAAWGAAAAERAVRQVETLVRTRLRAADGVYRLGDDEFVLVLPNANCAAAHRVAETLLHAVRAMAVVEPKAPGGAFRVTASIGLDAFDEQTIQEAAGVLAGVDDQLWAAKAAGRNRVHAVVHEELEQRLSAAPPVAPRRGERFLMRATAISQGIAIGRAYLYEDILNDIAYYEIEEAQIGEELERMRSAVRRARADVERMEKQVRLNIGREYADIFAVHRAILSDVSLISEMEERLKHDRRNAEHVVRSVFKHFESRFISSGDALVRERSLDIADLGRRLLRNLSGRNRNIFSRLPKNSIVVAKRLLPSESVFLRRGNVAGIITEKGSRNSHAAILARGLGIPYVSEPDAPIDRIPAGAYLIVDADRGEIVVNPSAEDREAIRSAIALQTRETNELITRFKDITLRRGGTRISVMANVGTRHTIAEAAAFGCDGIGLCRIEQAYMQSRVFPTQEQLARTLDEMFAPVRDKDIVVRLLDIGGDKTLPYFSMKDDLYSVLGVRGVRLLLRYPRILETQLAALLKLSRKYRISILIPMVTLPGELAAVRAALERAKRHLERRDVAFNAAVKLGSMIEVPAAVVGIRDILAQSDFVSIGTNDLIQYTMATARENGALASYYEAGTEAVLGFIGQTLDAARAAGVPCSLCGELAADTACTARLLAMGLEIFSVSPSAILKLKSTLAGLLRETP